MTTLVSQQSSRDAPPPCKICARPTKFFDSCDFHANVRIHYGYYDKPISPSGILLDFYRCTGCGFLFSTFMDEWTDQQFAAYVYNKDYPRLDGSYNGYRAGALSNILYLAFHDRLPQLDILDYGGGIGLQSALLSAFGAKRAMTYDPFAAGSKRPEGKFNIVTCLEVLEHSTDPKKLVADLVTFLDDDSGFLFTTTEFTPPDIEEQRNKWWYIAPRVGHISFYTQAALEILFAPYGYKVTHIEHHTHIFYKQWPVWAETFLPGSAQSKA